MSGGGALQQRTTYLISLTLVKVEAVEENGGEAKNRSQGKDVESRSGDKAQKEVGGDGEAQGEACGQAQTGAGVVSGQLQKAEDVTAGKLAEANVEGKDGKRKSISPLKDKPSSSSDVLNKGEDKPPFNLSIPLPGERATVQKTKPAETDFPRVETALVTPEAKQCRSPSCITTPPKEICGEPSRTPTRTSLPIRPAGQRPVSLLKSHSNVATRGRDSRDGRERSPTSAQSLDRKDCRMVTRSPGPCRASWAEASRPEAWRDLRDEVQAGIPLDSVSGMAVMRDNPRKERLKAGSSSLPAPASQAPKPARKGKSRTLDNSDLNSLSEDLGLVRDAHQAQRGSAKDRKMLKFISGIFTKSSSGVSTAPPVYIQRDSSEEEGKRALTHTVCLSHTLSSPQL